MILFEALYGRPPPPKLVDYILGDWNLGSLDEILQQRQLIMRVLKENLHRAHNRMIQQANIKRSDKTFEPDQWVYLKLKPYQQLSVKDRVSQKLSKRYYGPFRIGLVAYELELPPTARIHPVFLVWLLKECHCLPDVQVCPLQPTEAISLVPLCVLQQRNSMLDGKLQEQFLVQWVGQTPLEATWEDKHVLLQDYPTFDLEDMIIFDRHGNDTRSVNKGNMRQEASEKESQVVDPSPKRNIKRPRRFTN